MPQYEDFDACVIGTGADGGVRIDCLTAAGRRVIALEKGPWLLLSDFDDDELRNVVRDEIFSPHQLETDRFAASSPSEAGRAP